MRPTAPQRPATARLWPLLLLSACLAGPGCAGPGSAQQSREIRLEDQSAKIAQARRIALSAQDAETPGEAIDAYRSALDAYNGLGPVWNNLGVVLLDEGRYLEAAESFASASERSPTDPRPLYNLGLTWERAGYLEDALTFYGQALNRDPRYLPALRGAIRTERYLGLATEQTLDRLRRALLLEQDPRWRAWFQRQRPSVEEELYSQPGMHRPGRADG